MSCGAAAEQVGLKSGLSAPARLHVPAALTGKGVAARRAEEHATIMSKSQLSGLDRWGIFRFRIGPVGVRGGAWRVLERFDRLFAAIPAPCVSTVRRRRQGALLRRGLHDMC